MQRIRIKEGCYVPNVGEFTPGDLVTRTPDTEFLITQKKGVVEEQMPKPKIKAKPAQDEE